MRVRLGTVLLFSLLPLPLPLPLQSADWDPEDTTFDPTIESVVVQGATRIGDPTPFYKEGMGVQSYTTVEAKPDDNLGAMIWFSLIVPFVPGQTGPQEGASIFLSIDQAETLIKKLETALTSPDKEKTLGTIFPEGNYQQWTVKIDPSDSSLPIVLEMEMNEETDRYHFGINPTKKLIDSLKKVSAKANEIASGGN